MNAHIGSTTSEDDVEEEARIEAAEAVPLRRVEAFLKQLSHDVRNDLNAMDLLISYAEDHGGVQKAVDALDQLHGAVRYGSKRMIRISKAFQIPTPDIIVYPADLLFEDLRERFRMEHPTLYLRVHWEMGCGVAASRLSVDPMLAFEAITELIENAAAFSPREETVSVRIDVSEGGVCWRVQQSCPLLPEGFGRWGIQPLESSRRAHYGLGLFRVRRVLRALAARLDFYHDDERALLVTEVLFPGCSV